MQQNNNVNNYNKMLTEQELVNQIASGSEKVLLDEDVVSIDIPQIEMRVMMIHNSLIKRLEIGSIQIDKIDWVSFMDSIFEINDGIDFINRIQNKELRNKILYYWIDNYDEIVGNVWRKDLWISEWRDICEK